MIKRLLLIIWILIIILSIPSFAVELELPDPNPSFYVYDGSSIISKEAEEYIIRTNEELYKRTGAQIVVVTIDSLDNGNINEYAVKLFEKWGIGSREYDNGILMLIVTEERQIWIEVGYGLERALPDSKVGNIIEDSIIPYFKEERYTEGIISGFNNIVNEVEKEYNIQLNRDRINEDLYNIDDFDGIKYENDIFSGLKAILIAIGIVIFFIIDFRFFNGFLTYSLLFRGRGFGGYNGRGGRNNRGGGGRSGGGGAGGRW
jgi:uncharacterized protein